MQDIGSKTKDSLIWNTSLKLGFQVFRFAISIVIARILDPRDFGIMGIASMIILYSDNLTSLGLNRSLIRNKEISDMHVNTVFTINFSISLLFTSIIVIFSQRIADFFNMPELRSVMLSLSCIFIISTFYQIPLTLMRRQLDFRIVALAELYRGIAQSLITLILAVQGLKYWSLVSGFISSYILALIYVLIKVKWKPEFGFKKAALKDVFSFGIWNFMRVQISQVNEFADKFIIGKFLGADLLGFYDKAYSTVSMQKGSFTAQISSVMFSSFSRLQSETGEVIRKYLKKTLSVTSLITFPLNICLFALGEHFVTLLLGPKWEPMIPVLRVMSIAYIFYTISDMCSNINICMGSYVKQTVREGCCNIILVILSLVAVNYGIEYVAFTVLGIYALIFFMTFQLTKEVIEMTWKDLVESLMPASIGSVLMLAVISILKRYIIQETNLANFVMLLVSGGSIYGVAVLFPRYPLIEEYRYSMISHVKNIFSKGSALSKD